MTTNNNTLTQTDMFSLFGIEDEYAERKKKEEEERLKKQQELTKKMAEAKKNDSSSKQDTFEVNADTIIYFYTETIQISDYFTTEELENGLPKKGKDGEVEYKKISEADVKNRLKKEYPVIVAGAQLVYIKKENIVSVILQAKKKGNTDCNKESDLKSGSFPSKRKIPFSLLKDFIAISKHYSDNYGTEVHADIYFNVPADVFFMDIPHQQAYPLSVEVIEEPYKTSMSLLERDTLKVMEIHSHHVMTPTPSSQDDESERLPLLYAIVGRIGNFFPELTVRTFDLKSGKHINLKVWDIFEYPFAEIPSSYDLSVVEVAE